ncbi:XTP/dITP diphosphohydrolase [Chitinophaga ginsengisegetis]|uniref:Nucleoside triphosphate pyrophosphohydrolase n=1 Tax=Chitinophaga ginsengisegetis TaxID=393003 RepID=A0A1T5PBK2_9BACT|nr:nucleoside triphosphate pyrophosphohydrolase [Chitinophaga ginsengisegetis]MDR6569396.1 XTP/dITP diphosphohydrolase [Chitinophaga ginsengisegetis]MDR6648573.1 XTP/dITP diphosphohydrolase [Chitinophaga ginsengisegetis]MDR6655479.1 XTP/dITP diphosphohydrolase [Chitinophaga ginsengisegetis]SKD10124.1 XTP/dITP diphosphohydrolase [Chitinophaga ginsengisegetis]
MEKTATFDRLLQIMDDLREKCPWDRKQTIQTLRQLTIEETYELADAITDEDWKSIKEELGDILLHIVFYAKIGSEQQKFDINDVINGVCDKLIHRHPHIYGDVKADTEEEVKQNWEKLKLKEGKKSVLSGVPLSLPALVKAMRLQEKAKQTGFEWDNTEQVWEKVKEEVNELEEAVNSGNINDMEDEFGDVMFSLVNYSRFLNIDAENALERTNKKFQRRFQAMEVLALEQGRTLNDMSLTEMDTLWNKVKATEQL